MGGKIDLKKRLAAIDIGSNSIRLMIAEATPDGDYRVLDDEKETTRLAQGLGKTGQLSEEAMQHSLEALARMKAIVEGYGVERTEVIATSAVREASNRRKFVKLIRDRLGLDVQVISCQDEGRLSFRSVERHFDLRDMNAVIVDLGGGSTELVFAANGIIDDISSLPTGSVSLTERYVQSDPPSERDLRRLRKAIRKSFNSVVGDPDYAPQVMIGAGGTFMALANISIRLRGQSFSSIGGYELSRSEVRHILDYLRHMPLRERRSVPGLNADRADIIVAGLVVIDRFMKYLKVNRLLIHDRGVRDGLLLNMISQAFGKKLVESDEKLDPLASVQQFAAACGFEQRHSQHVTRMALEIFDQLREPLGLAPEERLLLEAAGLLHEIGYLINYEKHHLHSYHLIMHGNFRGLSPRQRELVANIARYHRRSGPKKKHDNFACLTPEDQAVVRRLAAILRLADGLDRTHMQRVKTLQCHWKKDHVLIIVGADRLPDVDLWGAQKKGKLFQKVLGLGLVLAWHPTENQKLETKN